MTDSGDEPFDASEDLETPQFNDDIPFVACETEGGPFEDESFIAGTQYGAVEMLTIMEIPIINALVDERLLAQIDLLAMGSSYSIVADHATGIEGAVRVTLCHNSVTEGTDVPDFVPDFDI
jgi:hypothetical protein